MAIDWQTPAVPDTDRSIEWTRRALAVLTAESIDPDGNGLSSTVFTEMVAPTDHYDQREAALAYATGMGNIAKILLGQVALERDITRAEACELLSHIIAEIEDDLSDG